MQTSSTVDALENDKQKKNRPKCAECPTCGAKLATKRKQTNGKNASGRCLVCTAADQDDNEDRSNVPKIVTVPNDDAESCLSEVTLDRRLLSVDEELGGCSSSRKTEDVSRHAGSNLSSRALNPTSVDGVDVESVLTESENDDDGANHMRKSHSRSARSINNNSSHHNAVSLSSSAKNRWGESVVGMDGDSTGPRPQPPRRVPSKEAEKSQSVHQSLPSKVTITTTGNSTCQSSPPDRSCFPKLVSGTMNQRHSSTQQSSTKVPRVIIPNSPAKKSNFTPPWNPKNPTNDNNNARKQNDYDLNQKAKDDRTEIVFVSNTLHDHKQNWNEIVPAVGGPKKVSRKSNSKKIKEYFDVNEYNKARPLAYEISLVGSNNFETKQYSDFDPPRALNFSEIKDTEEVDKESRTTGGQLEDANEVDIAPSANHKIISLVKNNTPKTKKQRQALRILKQMEQVFPSEDRSLSSLKPPKKAMRAGSVEIDWAIVPHDVLLFGSRAITGDVASGNNKVDHFSNKMTIMDVQQLLSSIANEESPDRRSHILRVLTYLVWTKETYTHREQFAKANGMEVLRTLLLTEMHLSLQTAVLKLMLVLVTGACEIDGLTPSLSVADNADMIADVVLVALEKHINVEEIQLLGCQVLCCLSSELSASRNVMDGSNSGACMQVLAAMEAHTESVAMQEWGIRCLYNQCVHSKHAESNRRSVLLTIVSQSTGQCINGSDIILRVLQTSFNGHQTNLVLLEWTCNLYKALCASEGITELLSPATDLLRELLHFIEFQNREFTASSDLLEVALCIISRLLDIEHNKSCVNVTDSFIILLETIHSRSEDVEVVTLCCSVMSKLVTQQSLRKDILVGISTARRIINIMIEHHDERRLREAGTGVLACLCHDMEGFKHKLCNREAMEQLMNLWHKDTESSETAASLFQENVSMLLVSLFASESERLRTRAVRYGALDLLGKVIERGMTNAKVQELAVVGLMNLATGSSVDCLIGDGVNYAEVIIRTMEANKSASQLQKNGCCALWNIGVKSDVGIVQIIRSNGVSCMISSLQAHLQNPDVVVVACGTLWSLSLHDVAFKRKILGTDGAMEVIVQVILVNADCPSVQEQACGILASVASSISESNAHKAGTCVSKLIDAMRIDSNILPVLQCGAKFLRQVVVYIPEYADHACETLTVLIKAMKKYRGAHAFQEDACNFLWTLAEKSSAAKDRILNTEGISTVVEILDQSSIDQNKEKVVVEAFKELAISNT